MKKYKEIELSPYMPAHLGLGDEGCCGIFDQVNDDGIVYCNECGMNINDAISKLRRKFDKEGKREMKSIICKAYHIKEKKWYWFDVLWGNTAQQGGGYIGMLPIEVAQKKHIGGINGGDNRELIDPDNCKIYVTFHEPKERNKNDKN